MHFFESNTLIVIAMTAAVCFFVWLFFKNRLQNHDLKRLQIKMASDALDKFGTAQEFLDLVFRRTAWAAHSLILGGEDFCRKMIDHFKLHPLTYGNPTPFRLSGTLCNAHRRAGPHAC